ncbi:hypothetical protein [Pseudomonas aeruginosa]|uniref:hypothetical protein n=1 Tax=Pseudomonas aeruginosa TaxID=287 RepID=UPI003D9C9C07
MSVSRDDLIAIIDKSSGADRVSSVSELSRRSGLSRTALYKYHRGVIEYMRARAGALAETKVSAVSLKLGLLRNSLNKAKEENSALARACVELIAELVEVKMEMENSIEERDLRIKYLEDQLRLGGRGKPRLIK